MDDSPDDNFCDEARGEGPCHYRTFDALGDSVGDDVVIAAINSALQHLERKPECIEAAAQVRLAMAYNPDHLILWGARTLKSNGDPETGWSIESGQYIYMWDARHAQPEDRDNVNFARTLAHEGFHVAWEGTESGTPLHQEIADRAAACAQGWEQLW